MALNTFDKGNRRHCMIALLAEDANIMVTQRLFPVSKRFMRMNYPSCKSPKHLEYIFFKEAERGTCTTSSLFHYGNWRLEWHVGVFLNAVRPLA